MRCKYNIVKCVIPKVSNVSLIQIYDDSALFQYFGHTTSLLQLDAKHGFTNPAQVHNNNAAFGYHPEAANKAWHQALALLTRRIPADTAFPAE